jgi:DNA-directed RNA polymerase alpha subunit
LNNLEYPDITGDWPDEVADDMIAFVKQFGSTGPDAHGAALLAATWLILTQAGYQRAANAAYHAILLAMPPEVYIQMCKLRAHFGEWRKDRLDRQSLLSRPVDELETSVRVAHCFERSGVKTVGDLVQKTAVELLHEPNFGAASLLEVRSLLKRMGLSLTTRNIQR